MITYQERVGRGAAWLDVTRPQWFNEVDLEKLDLASGQRCVLGQIVVGECSKPQWENVVVQGGYVDFTVEDIDGYEGVVGVFSSEYTELLNQVDDLAALRLSNSQAFKRGFHLGDEEDDTAWRSLTKEWRRQIMLRRAAAAADEADQRQVNKVHEAQEEP